MNGTDGSKLAEHSPKTTSTGDLHVKEMHSLICTNYRASVHDIEDHQQNSFYTIFTDNLRTHGTIANYLPCLLIHERNLIRVTASQEFLDHSSLNQN
ncbi:hypothetical protein AVEN_125915-1 [Araneus ventricosus]|uniref:Uncharacterized protein n=1 Tax=Araneus ventricosus TaxID=182803 RepID=A0A4Y2V2H7_ARAVE|nr:hypothetical protein AVEN_155241-1 [Araneus ventricosus]GBO18073.1 hypothetical protein AVEN_124943-1 [Araneus ventricosus]GBO18533.1 hypothetical protein AVEN_125915-1 [Araneus ventricosus]